MVMCVYVHSIANAVHPSVCPSLTPLYCLEMADYVVMQLSLDGSVTLIFSHQMKSKHKSIKWNLM